MSTRSLRISLAALASGAALAAASGVALAAPGQPAAGGAGQQDSKGTSAGTPGPAQSNGRGNGNGNGNGGRPGGGGNPGNGGGNPILTPPSAPATPVAPPVVVRPPTTTQPGSGGNRPVTPPSSGPGNPGTTRPTTPPSSGGGSTRPGTPASPGSGSGGAQGSGGASSGGGGAAPTPARSAAPATAAAAVPRNLPTRGLSAGSGPVDVAVYLDLSDASDAATYLSVTSRVLARIAADRSATITLNPIIMGSDANSMEAALAVLAAAGQNRAWCAAGQVATLRSTRGGDWINRTALRSIARTCKLSSARFVKDATGRHLYPRLNGIREQAQADGVGRTPSYVVKGGGGTQVLLNPGSADTVASAIAGAS